MTTGAPDVACRFCQHATSDHNLMVGCVSAGCRCMATPGEGQPITDAQWGRTPLNRVESNPIGQPERNDVTDLYHWTDFESDDCDCSGGIFTLTIWSPNNTVMAHITHVAVNNPLDGPDAGAKRHRAQRICDALNTMQRLVNEAMERIEMTSNQYRDAVETAKRHEVWVCPRCDHPTADFPALSRKDNQTAVCSRCGTEEAMRQFAGLPAWPTEGSWPFMWETGR